MKDKLATLVYFIADSMIQSIFIVAEPVVQDIAMLFFAGGSETIRTSVEWLLLTAATHQDFQRRIHFEIDETVGRDQCISWENRSSMPFTEAFINELMRWITILPLNLLR